PGARFPRSAPLRPRAGGARGWSSLARGALAPRPPAGPPPGMPRPFHVCVFCGSRTGSSPAYAEAAAALGRRIGERGLGLVYGGARVGLMGSLADAALAAGALGLRGVPRSLFSGGVAHAARPEAVLGA